MSIKENLDYIKTEFSGDEKILENAFKLEILYKRYKRAIWAVGIIVILAIVAYFGHSYYKEYSAKKSSAIFNALSENPSDEKLREQLKNQNIELYNLFLLKDALEKGNVAELSELGKNSDLSGYIAQYHASSFDRDASALEKTDKYLLGDFATLQKAYVLIEEGNNSAASLALQSIPQDSPLINLANLLIHYVEANK